jgi:membrane protease YdiL (CAAX protease family)
MEAPPTPRPGVSPPYRLVVFILTTAAGVLALRIVAGLLAPHVRTIAGLPFAVHATVWMLALGLLIGHFWTFRLVEPRGWSVVGLGREALRPRALALGAVLAVLAAGIPSLLLLAVGWLRVEAAAAGSSLGSGMRALALLVPAALWEELLLRGYLFAVLREVWGTTRALVSTSVVFGLMHFQNDGAAVQSVLMVALAGVFLGSVLITTGSLYAAWAAHLAWNSVLAVILHSAVSGITLPAPDYRVVDAGPDWATGGAWGPEGGVLAGIGMLSALVFLYRRPRRRGA